MRVLTKESNPNWRGGEALRACVECATLFSVKPCRAQKAKFCSLSCANMYMRRVPLNKKSRGGTKRKPCEECGNLFTVFSSHLHRSKTCGAIACASKYRSKLMHGPRNPNWGGGLSMRPYPWRFREARKVVLSRDQNVCQNATCRGEDQRITVHHIDYDKANCAPDNLIVLCSSCNSRANFGRDAWAVYYNGLIAVKKTKQGWEEERF